jgi:hypothetical protein
MILKVFSNHQRLRSFYPNDKINTVSDSPLILKPGGGVRRTGGCGERE